MAPSANDVTIRRARPDEAAALTELMLRAKGHWGYDQAFLAACRPLLTISAATIARDAVYCAVVGETLAGICHVKPLDNGEAYLDDLFVEPVFMGTGIGALLWRHAVGLAIAMGAHALVFDADPNALLFYERMGAVVVGALVSTTFPGHTTPSMRYEVPSSRATRHAKERSGG